MHLSVTDTCMWRKFVCLSCFVTSVKAHAVRSVSRPLCNGQKTLKLMVTHLLSVGSFICFGSDSNWQQQAVACHILCCIAHGGDQLCSQTYKQAAKLYEPCAKRR